MDEQVKTNAGQGFGIASLILGILALLIAFIPCIGFLAIIPGVVAIVLAIVGLSQAGKAQGAKGVIIAGLVVSIIGTILAATWLILFSAGGIFFNEMGKEPFKRKIESVVKEFNSGFEKEYGKEVDKTIDDFGKQMEKTLDELEEQDTTGYDFENLSDEEKAQRVGKAAGKALKEISTEKADSSLPK